MTTNAFIFSWDINGVEAIVPITQYEDWDTVNAFATLRGESAGKNPLWEIVSLLKLRAQANSQRYYEIYAVDCDADISETEWRRMWETNPQSCADLIRDRGVHIYGEPISKQKILIR